MANTVINVKDALASNGKGGGGDLITEIHTLTATDGTATWTVSTDLSIVAGFSFAKGQDAAPTVDDEGNYYIDEDKNAAGYWVVSGGTLAIARVAQATGGTLAADNVSLILHGY